jgi:hypothetical protein
MDQQSEQAAEWRRLEACGITSQQIAWQMHVNRRTVTRWRARWRKKNGVEALGSVVNVPERPEMTSDEEYMIVAWHIAAVYRARLGASAAQGAEMAEMLGVPRKALIAAREKKPANPGQV